MAYSQNPCGFDKHQNEYLNVHPEAKNELLNSLNSNARINVNTVYKIPVIFMVAHTGQNEGQDINLSRKSLLQGVAALNKWFKDSGTFTSKAAVAGTPNIEFELATIDRSGNAFNGVLRSDCSTITNYSNGVDFDNSLNIGTTASTLIQHFENQFGTYESRDYYRVYVVNKVNGAYAFASTGYCVMPAFGLEGSTFPHETGHYLSLPHTFAGGGSETSPACPSNSNCATDGDRFCDTPPHPHPQITNTADGDKICPSGVASPVLKYNFMNYYQDPIMFTTDQVNQMRSHIQSSSDKQNLVLREKAKEIAKPVVDFAFEGSCSGEIISFLELTENGPTSYSWDFGDNSNSTEKNPSHTYAQEGTYTISLTASNTYGTTVKSKTIDIRNTLKAYQTPNTQGLMSINPIGKINFGGKIVEFSNIFSGYSDDVCSTYIFEAGNTYYSSVILRDGLAANSSYAIYADFNQDGKFDGQQEKISSGIKPSASEYKVDFTLNIPQTVLSNKKIRLRILFGDATNDVQTTNPLSGVATVVKDISAFIIGGTTSSDFTNNPTSVTNTSFDITWNAPQGSSLTPSGYLLDVAYDELFNNKVSGYDDKDVTSSNSTSITGLQTGATYYYRIKAQYSSDNNYLVVSSAKNVKAVGQYDNDQTNHLSIATSTNTAVIKWDEGTNGNTLLQVSSTPYDFTLPTDGTTYTNNSSAGSGKTWWVTSNDSIIVTGLNSEQTYYVRAFDYTGTTYNQGIGRESILPFSTVCNMLGININQGQGHPTDFSLSTLSVPNAGNPTSGTPVLSTFGNGAATLNVGVDYQGSYNVVSGYSTKGYIDFNKNGVFELSEEVYDNSSQKSQSSQIFTINIPTTVAAGVYVLRVSARFNAGNIAPCGSSGYGGAVDYQLNVENSNCTSTSITANSASLSAINADCSLATITPPTATTDCGFPLTATTTTTFPITASTTVFWVFDDGNGNQLTQSQSVTISSLNNAYTVANNTITASASGTGITYQWYNCSNNSAISGATSSSYSPSASGSYKVKISKGTCEVYSSCYQYTAGCTIIAITPSESSLTTLSSFCEITQLTPPSASTNCNSTIQATTNVSLPITTSTDITWTYSANGITETQTQRVEINGSLSISLSSGILSASINDSNYTYQWYTCGSNNSETAITSATSSTYTPLTSGSYKVKVSSTASSCSTITSTCFDFIVTSLVDNLWLKEVYIYPNPSESKLNIGGVGNKIFSYKIITQDGKIISEQKGLLSNESIETSQLKNGLYLIQIESNDNIKTLKFLKK
ncbi:GEVED domain-containing protein [Flammeovirga pectinis]|nr:GEVED domain-containing protein [Flammeovirga pectinis]